MSAPRGKNPIIRIRQLKKVFRVGEERVRALDGIDLDIFPNEFVAIMGASGSGKSTLMNILGCLDKPTSGQYILNGHPTHKMGMGKLAQVRNQEIGFIFQSYELLNRSTALRNVMLPMLYSKHHIFSARRRAKDALRLVGLDDRMSHRPNQLSGGQRQRVAIARSLVNEPSMILADEPTGNLDSKTTVEIIDLFTKLHKAGQTIVVVTHEEDVAGHARRIVRLRDGRIISDYPSDEDPIHLDWVQRMSEGRASITDAELEINAKADAERRARLEAEKKNKRSLFSRKSKPEAVSTKREGES
ncbi:MAG: macrolide ABC transporter ATP-binding protein [Phycisphaerae bacterium]|nr:macrolide ABC transporter ATP-binding protein [Phycisphaerae bacterium]MBM90065.1 macrolide ABC transporter ATP-binding protein [Phycisphaerae bacterium]